MGEQGKVPFGSVLKPLRAFWKRFKSLLKFFGGSFGKAFWNGVLEGVLGVILRHRLSQALVMLASSGA